MVLAYATPKTLKGKTYSNAKTTITSEEIASSVFI